MIKGTLFILAACFCWAIVFVLPNFLVGFNPVEISLGRFFIFGLISFIILLAKKRYLLGYSYRPLWIKAFWYGLLSTILCYTFLVFSVRYANASIATLIYAMSPIVIPLCGNWKKQEYPFRQFLIPGLLMGLGIILTNLNAFSFMGVSTGYYVFGIISGFLCLASWVGFAIGNFHFMKQNSHLSILDWTIMTGAATFFLVILSVFGYGFVGLDLSKYSFIHPGFGRFLVGSLILGVVSSWCATFFWNLGNKLVPVSLAGQLTIFEVIFGLILIYFAEQRLPYSLEFIGIVLMLGGVLMGFKTLRKIEQAPSIK